MKQDPNIEKDLFAEALELPSDQREGFLKGACRSDEQLRQRVEDLLRVHGDASRILKTEAELPTIFDNPQVLEGPGTIIGRYKLLQVIGEGGMGVVYMAEQEEPVRRRVALKIIKLGMDTKSVIARFEAERQALAMMDHPNIAKVLDGGATEAGRPYFVMELVRGIKITEYCDEAKLSTRDRLDLFIKACQAIQHAHQKGIIHRDIKPSNILVTINDGVAVPKVIDFGIAKATEGRLTDRTLFTQFEALMGTPAYMSPEQAVMTSLDIDTRSDIYSLGVLLYELLAGSTPFDAKELMASGIDAMRKTIREKEPLRPSTKLSQTLVAADVRRRTSGVTEESASSRRRLQEQIHQLQGDLDWIVMKCLEKDRARRYETANGLASDIQRHLNNEAVLARPASAAYRLQKAFRRNKLVFATATAVAAALAIGLGAATVMFFRERLARNGEQQQRLKAESALKVAETEQQRADAQARKATESQQQSRRLLYASDMKLAQQSLKFNNLGQARQLLERHRPQPGEEELRGWEWRYLWQLTRSSALVTLTNRPTRGTSVSFSPDGTRLAVGWSDGRVDLWDVAGRRLVRALTDCKDLPAAHVAFSPVRNLLAATSESNVITLYNLDLGWESLLWRAPDQGEWEVRNLAFSQDGSKAVIYAGSRTCEFDEVWVLNVSSSQIEGVYATSCADSPANGSACLSSDNQRLYLTREKGIQCLDLATGQEVWQTESQPDWGVTKMAISPDGRILASGSSFVDPTIRIWDTATGRPLAQLKGHTSFIFELAFTGDGGHLFSAAADQTICSWDTSTWLPTRVLRGHTDEVHALAISEPPQLIASAGRDGNLMLWQQDTESAPDGYSRLPQNLTDDQVLPLDHSRVLLLPSGNPPQLMDLKDRSAPMVLTEFGSSTNVLGWFGTNILCQWNGTNQILVHELRGAEFTQRGAIALDSSTLPTGFTYNPTRQLLAWTEGSSAASVYLASLAAPGRRIELKSNVPGILPFRFSEDGTYLAAYGQNTLRVWNVETGQIAASIEDFNTATFAERGQVLVVAITLPSEGHEIRFYDLTHQDRKPRHLLGNYNIGAFAVSPAGGLVAASTWGGPVRLCDPAKGEWIEDLHGHMNASQGVAFSPDGRRLISTFGGREAVKLWDVGTRQELLTLDGTVSSLFGARWSADGDVILAGAPWQAWRAPSWEEIAAAEAKEKTEIKPWVKVPGLQP